MLTYNNLTECHLNIAVNYRGFSSVDLHLDLIFSLSNLHQKFIRSLSVICYGLDMNGESQKIFIETSISAYWKMGLICCPALNNENVIFNRHGLRHIFWKRNARRTINDQIRRFKLLPYAKDIILSSTEFTKYHQEPFQSILGGKVVQFWTFTKKLNAKTIHIIIRQLGHGQKHFFSIMD